MELGLIEGGEVGLKVGILEPVGIAVDGLADGLGLEVYQKSSSNV